MKSFWANGKRESVPWFLLIGLLALLSANQITGRVYAGSGADNVQEKVHFRVNARQLEM